MKLLIIVLLIPALSIQILAFNASALSAPKTNAKADFLMNMTTGEIYYEKNADAVRAPASLTKLMTVYMLYEALNCGEITKNTQVRISKHAQSIASIGSNVPLYYGKYYSVDELLHAVMTVSANGAACALAELLSGSESTFAANMTATAQKLGWNMKFYDASGLNNNNCVTARSIAYLASTLITKYPDILNYSSCSSIVFRGKKYNATNRLLPGRGFTYKQTDGLKTGTTSKAGCCLVSTTMRNGNRLLTVVLGSCNDKGRYNDTIKMLNYGFSRAITLYASKQKFVLNGNHVTLNAYTANGKNYVCLKNLAEILSGTEAKFSVGWDETNNTIIITSGESDIVSSSKESFPKIAGAKLYSDNLLVNGKSVKISGYVINESYYLNINELASVIGLDITYNNSLVYLTTKGTARMETVGLSTANVTQLCA